jgi:protein-tyrosine phosphatase
VNDLECTIPNYTAKVQNGMQKIFYSFLCSVFLTNVMKVLFVCLGNICRSPAAEGIFTHLIKKNGLEKDVCCDSAGTIGNHAGEGAYPKMKKVAAGRGYNLTSVSRKVRPEKDFDKFDLVIGMDDHNIADLKKMVNGRLVKARICKMTDYCTRHKNTYVPDPYYGDTKDYELVIDLLEDACEGLIESLVKR